MHLSSKPIRLAAVAGAAVAATTMALAPTASASTTAPIVTHGLVAPKAVTPADTSSPIPSNPTPDPTWGWAGVSNEKCDTSTQVFSVRTQYTSVTSDFLSAGSISTTNTTADPIPLTQSLTATQTLTFSVTAGFQGSYEGTGGSLSGTASYQVAWTTGQQIGPFNVAPGQTTRATYGFDVLRFTALQQRCTILGLWTMPQKVSGIAPVDAHVIVDSYAAGSPALPTPGTPVSQATAGMNPIARS